MIVVIFQLPPVIVITVQLLSVITDVLSDRICSLCFLLRLAQTTVITSPSHYHLCRIWHRHLWLLAFPISSIYYPNLYTFSPSIVPQIVIRAHAISALFIPWSVKMAPFYAPTQFECFLPIIPLFCPHRGNNVLINNDSPFYVPHHINTPILCHPSYNGPVLPHLIMPPSCPRLINFPHLIMSPIPITALILCPPPIL